MVLFPVPASAQTLLRRGLDSDLVSLEFGPNQKWAETVLVSPSMSNWATYRLGVSTRRNTKVTDLYQERVIGTQFTLPLSHQWTLESTYEYSGAAGRYSGNTSNGNGNLSEHRFDGFVGYKSNHLGLFEVGWSNSTASGSVDSTLLGTSIPVLGKDPRLHEEITRSEIPIEWKFAVSRQSILTLHAGAFTGTGELVSDRTDGKLPTARLSFPLAADGTNFGIAAHHDSGNYALDLQARSSFGAKDQESSLDGDPFGPSRFSTETRNIGIAIEKDWRSRGKIRLHYENASSEDKLTTFIANPNQLGYNLPPSATAVATGTFQSRRSEIGIDWRTTTPTTTFGFGYRQMQLPFALRGSVTAQEFLFSITEDGSLDYSDVSLGVLDFYKHFQIGHCKASFGVQQIIPFRLSQAGQSGTSGGISGSSTGSKSIGGTSLSISLTVPLG